jgi:hypothetical protein
MTSSDPLTVNIQIHFPDPHAQAQGHNNAKIATFFSFSGMLSDRLKQWH